MHDWQHLGLEGPTTDLATIKRAYARRLRDTRPDDDAQAYQTLREAYDRLLQRARWSAAARPMQAAERTAASAADDGVEAPPRPQPEAMAEGAEAASDTPAGTTLTATCDTAPAANSIKTESTAAPAPANEADARRIADDRTAGPDAAAPAPAPASAPAPPSAPAPNLTPAQLQDQLAAICAQGRDAVEAWLPELTRQLHLLPLALQAEASARMADFVLRSPHLPESLLRLLCNHFSWLDDFRTARLIGAGRAEALHEALAGLERGVTDATLLSRYAETLAFNELVSAGRSLRSLAVATLLHSVLRRQLTQAGQALLQRFGIDAARQRRLTRQLASAEQIHMVGVSALIFAVALLLTQDLQRAALGFGVALIIALPGLFIQLYLLRLLYGLRVFTSLPARWARAFKSPRWRAALPWAAISLLAAGMAAIAAADAFLLPPLGALGLLLMVLGLLHGLPATLDQAIVAAALWLYAVMTLKLSSALAHSLLLLWVLAGMHVNLSRLYRIRWLEGTAWRFHSKLLEAMLLATIGLPTLLSRLTETLGYKRVLYALALAASPLYVDQVPQGAGRWPLMPGALVAALALLALCHNRALKLGRRLLARDAHLYH